MKRFWKIFLWVAGAILLLFFIGKAFGGNDDVKQVNVEKSARRSLTESVSASGKIQPETEVKIQSQVSGEIVELPVKEGDMVKQGQVLVRINPDLYESSANRAQASGRFRDFGVFLS